MRTLVLIVLLFLAPDWVEAQSAEIGLFHQSLVDDGDIDPRLFVEGYVYLAENMGVWGFAYGEKQYVSSVLGLFAEVLEFGEESIVEGGLAFGAETYPDDGGAYNLHPRVAGTLFVGSESLHVMSYYETWSGDADSWLRAEANWKLGENFTIGGFHQTGDGVGPRVMYSFSDSPVRIWIAPMVHHGEGKLLLALEIIFQED